MKLIVVGTGSTGNCYLLTDGQEILVLDAGLPLRAVKIALDFKIRGIKAVLVTHNHLDHDKYSKEYQTFGFPVFKPFLDENLLQTEQFGGFTVQSFPVRHNVPCVGYLIKHKDLGKMLYITDTEYVRYRFSDINTMLIEANYSDKYVNRNEAKYHHVITGHMELQTTLDCIEANAGPTLDHVILCHLSANGSDEFEFKKITETVVPIGCTVNVATAGLEVDLANIPF